MNIFENLENLNVSEECYIDILNMVESIISETKKESKEKRDKWMADQMSKEPVFSERSGGWVKKTAKQLLAGKKTDFENTSKAWKDYNKNEKDIKQLKLSQESPEYCCDYIKLMEIQQVIDDKSSELEKLMEEWLTIN